MNKTDKTRFAEVLLEQGLGGKEATTLDAQAIYDEADQTRPPQLRAQLQERRSNRLGTWLSAASVLVGVGLLVFSASTATEVEQNRGDASNRALASEDGEEGEALPLLNAGFEEGFGCFGGFELINQWGGVSQSLAYKDVDSHSIWMRDPGTVPTPAMIEDFDAWSAMWHEHFPDQGVPFIDFTQEVVIGVFAEGLAPLATGLRLVDVFKAEDQFAPDAPYQVMRLKMDYDWSNVGSVTTHGDATSMYPEGYELFAAFYSFSHHEYPNPSANMNTSVEVHPNDPPYGFRKRPLSTWSTYGVIAPTHVVSIERASGQPLEEELLEVVGSWEGDESAITGDEVVRVANHAEWFELWERHSPGTRAPDVDFSQHQVIGIFFGLEYGKPYETHGMFRSMVDDRRYVIGINPLREQAIKAGRPQSHPYLFMVVPRVDRRIEIEMSNGVFQHMDSSSGFYEKREQLTWWDIASFDPAQ